MCCSIMAILLILPLLWYYITGASVEQTSGNISQHCISIFHRTNADSYHDERMHIILLLWKNHYFLIYIILFSWIVHWHKTVHMSITLWPLLEYCTYLWSPYQNHVIDNIERVQKYFFKESSISNQTPLHYPTWSYQTWNIRNETN